MVTNPADTQWKMARLLHIAHPFDLHLVREMNKAANRKYSQLAIARVQFPASLPLELVAHGIQCSEYDGSESVYFDTDSACMHWFRTAYLECEATSTSTLTLSLADLASIHRQCRKVSVKQVFVSERDPDRNDDDVDRESE